MLSINQKLKITSGTNLYKTVPKIRAARQYTNLRIRKKAFQNRAMPGKLLNHEAKMCACTDIFARPSMPSPCRGHGWGNAPEAAKQHPTKAIKPRSENACLQGHFRETVNCADAPTARGGVSREELHSNSSRAYYTTKNLYCKYNIWAA